jgi:NADH dehydrogenase FAD-containing subunit
MGADVVSIAADTLQYRMGDVVETVSADHVIWATDVYADTSVADDLSAAGLNVVVVGDAADVTYIEGAVRTAYDALVTF